MQQTLKVLQTGFSNGRPPNPRQARRTGSTTIVKAFQAVEYASGLPSDPVLALPFGASMPAASVLQWERHPARSAAHSPISASTILS
ncbi:hypothetical protein [Bradyrhizobium valentinum]|uniref:hypothetical protein n=1 Tax=Bradyrhizobium valentinum TaxID=1518501 RepID=UPI0018D2715B|nr:hypothetical protein [Bradyrhizobium valentinum]